jgi:F-type H+-transporting ATPase subunit alpha
MSLLLRRPPGREAYPGDIFYLHSRLLERSCKLADRYVIAPADTPEDAKDVPGVDGKTYQRADGLAEAKKALEAMPDKGRHKVHRQVDSGGSLTALPIVETLEGEVSAYIPTNVISITDGQIYLEPGLFFSGVRPAVNAGISVSRVGYKAAYAAMKEVAKSLRLDLAAYRELESFAQMGMELDAASQRQVDRGMRMVRLLTQPQYQPMSTAQQVISIYAGVRGHLDDLAVDEVSEFEAQLLKFVQTSYADFYHGLDEDKKLPRERDRQLRTIITQFKDTAYKEYRRARRQTAGTTA